MKPPLTERVQSALDAFFVECTASTDSELEYSFEDPDLAYESTKQEAKTRSSIGSVLKGLFFYLPGVFVLHTLTAFAAWAAIADTKMLARARWDFIVLFLVLSSLFSTIGIGSVKNLRHLVIPAAVMFVGIITALIAVAAGFDHPKGLEEFVSYFLPFAYTAPFLAKYLVDKE